MIVSELFKKCKDILEAADVESSAFEVSVMMEDLISLPKSAEMIIPDQEVSDEKCEKMILSSQKRASGYPLQYIVGNWEFYGRKFLVGENVFIPRQDTELLCECAIKFFKGIKSPKIIDLCSGSGCIAVTLSEEIADSDVTAVELYKGAFEYLCKNVKLHGGKVKTRNEDALEPFGLFDGIVSNPPYITGEEMKCLQTEVTFEPETALFGGEDGLYFYREITKRWKPHLVDGGFLGYEIGDAESGDVVKILLDEGFKDVHVHKDLAGFDRVVTGRK